MKKMLLMLLMLSIVGIIFADSWTETFDDNHSSSYGTSFTFSISGTWTCSDAGNMAYANTNMGSYAFTINDDKAGAQITTPSLNTCGTVSFKYAYKNGNSTNVFKLQKSTDGTTFTDLDTHTLGSSANLSYVSYSYDVNDASSTLYIRVLSDDQNAHLFIEDFTVTDYSAGSNTTVQFNSGSTSVSEGVGTYDLTLTITNEDASNATTCDVVLTTGDAADVNNYTTQNVTFPAGSSANQTVTITVTDDSAYEGNETLTFSIQNVAGGNSAAAGSPADFDLTIEDNDPATTTIPYGETFDSDLGDCYTYSVSGATKEWFQVGGYAKMSGYNSGDTEEDWMILPGIDLDSYSNEIMTFDTYWHYGADDADNYLKLLYSTNYSGLGDPSSSTWTELSYTQGADATWTGSGNVDLSAISGTSVWLAFKYHGTSGSYRTWEVDNISIEEVNVNDPTVFSASTSSTSQIDLSWTKNANGDDVMVVYDTDNTFTDPVGGTSYTVGNSACGGTVIYNGSGTSYNHTGLTADTHYYYKAWSVDSSTNYSNGVTADDTTYKNEPSNHVTSFTATANGSSTIDLSWTANDGTVVPDGYLIKASTADNVSNPSDGTEVADNSTIGDDSGAINVAYGSTSYNWSGLTGSTTYYFKIYPYTNSGTAIDYKTDGTIPSGNATTSATVTVNARDIIINEIMYNTPSYDDEWVELYNTTSSSISLTADWSLEYSGSTYIFDGTHSIASHGYLTLALGSSNDGTFNSDNPFTADIEVCTVDNSGTNDTNHLSNSTATIKIIYSSTTINEVTYDDGSPWPTAADGSGPSLERIDPTLNDDTASNFEKSWDNGGTPGSQNQYDSDPSAPADGASSNYGTLPGGGGGSEFTLADASGGTTVTLNAFTIYSGVEQPNIGTYKSIKKYVHLSGTPSDGTTVYLYYTDAEFTASGIANESDLKVAAWDGSSWTIYPRGSASDTAANLVTAENVSSFSDWVLLEDAPLPVVLSDFYAEFAANELAIVWTTQSEVNLNGWNIYKANSDNFDTAIVMNGNLITAEGTSTESHTYRYVDNSNPTAGDTYYYWLESVDNNGMSALSNPISYTVPENDNPDSPNANTKYGLAQNYPNPFNPSTEIKFRLDKDSKAKLEIYNIKGQKVETLFDGFAKANQEISRVWNANTITSGVYFYKLTAGGRTITKKMILMK